MDVSWCFKRKYLPKIFLGFLFFFANFYFIFFFKSVFYLLILLVFSPPLKVKIPWAEKFLQSPSLINFQCPYTHTHTHTKQQKKTWLSHPLPPLKIQLFLLDHRGQQNWYINKGTNKWRDKYACVTVCNIFMYVCVCVCVCVYMCVCGHICISVTVRGSILYMYASWCGYTCILVFTYT